MRHPHKGERSPWFPVWKSPVRPGVYEMQLGLAVEPMLRYFDGKNWHWSDSPKSMYANPWPTDQWRGLAQPAED